MSAEPFPQTQPEQDFDFTWEERNVPLELIATGAHSSAYGFTDRDGQQRVLRTSLETDYGFQKDAYAAAHFNAPDLPIPAVQAVWEWKGTFGAVSEWKSGKRLHDMSREERQQTVPATVTAVQALHKLKPAAAEGYGWWNNDGKAEYPTWKSAMDRLRTLPYDNDLQTHPSEHMPLLERAAATANRLLVDCPEERAVIHGDLSSNIMFDGDKTTAVIDWSHSMIGDSLYDIAELGIHMDGKGIDYKEVFRNVLRSRGQLSHDYDKRITCYQILITISDMCWLERINGWSNSKKATILPRMEALLTEANKLSSTQG